MPPSLLLCVSPSSSQNLLRSFQVLQDPTFSRSLGLHTLGLFWPHIPWRNQRPKFMLFNSYKSQAHTSYFPRFAASPPHTPGLLDSCSHLPNSVHTLCFSRIPDTSKILLKVLSPKYPLRHLASLCSYPVVAFLTDTGAEKGGKLGKCCIE